jgi:ribonuclease G
VGIQERARSVSAPTLLYQDLDLSLRVLRDMANDDSERVLVDSRETCQRLLAFAQDYTSVNWKSHAAYSAERPLFELYAIEDEIEKCAGAPRDAQVRGYLIIDQTEALTTVDVNTGGFVGARSFDDTIFKTNLEAAQ